MPVYGINYKDKPEDARPLAEPAAIPTAPSAPTRTAGSAIDWGVYGVPETYVIDAQGRIRYRDVGPLMPDEVERDILPLLKELEG